MPRKSTLAQALAQALKERGVSRAFGVPGSGAHRQASLTTRLPLAPEPAATTGGAPAPAAPPAARHPSRAVSRGRWCNSTTIGAKDGKSCPGAKRPRRFRGVENDSQRNQKS